jgi:hypothetical protein
VSRLAFVIFFYKPLLSQRENGRRNLSASVLYEMTAKNVELLGE